MWLNAFSGWRPHLVQFEPAASQPSESLRYFHAYKLLGVADSRACRAIQPLVTLALVSARQLWRALLAGQHVINTWIAFNSDESDARTHRADRAIGGCEEKQARASILPTPGSGRDVVRCPDEGFLW